jgi:hypothetical protein
MDVKRRRVNFDGVFKSASLKSKRWKKHTQEWINMRVFGQKRQYLDYLLFAMLLIEVVYE